MVVSTIKRLVSWDERVQNDASSRVSRSANLNWNYAGREAWGFENGRITLNGNDVEAMVNSNRNDISFLSNLSSALQSYKNHVWENSKTNEHFNGSIQALQGKVARRLSDIYDEKTNSVSFEYAQDKTFWVNNIDPKKVMTLYQIRPTEKARVYLEGLKDKLNWIISHNSATNRFDGVRDKAKELHNQIGEVLEKVSVVKSLPSADRRSA